MTLDDLEGHFNCSKPLRGIVTFGWYDEIISVYWILSL